MHADRHDRTPALVLCGVSKTYGAVRAVRDVDLTVQTGSIHALVGENGSGKSTLVKILAGIVAADGGGSLTIAGQHLRVEDLTPRVAKAAGLHFVHQDPGLFPDMTVAENMCIGNRFDMRSPGRIHWRRTRSRVERVLARFEISATPRTRLAALRPAARTMVAIARALQDQHEADNGILLLDEPTAALSQSEVRVLLSALRRYAARGQTTVFISHRLDEVLTLCDTVSVLRDGRHVSTRSVTGLETDDLVTMMIGRKLHQSRAARQDAGPAILRVRDLRTGPLRGVDLDAARGEVLGVAGVVGSGRSRLLETLFGVRTPERGTIELDGAAVRHHDVRDAMATGFAYVPEDRSQQGCFADFSVTANLSAADVGSYWRRGHMSRQREIRDAQTAIAAFDIRAPSPKTRMADLSGGNQQKVILARWLRRRPRVLLLDEPTKGVDVAARMEIHRLIRRAVAADATALIVSSDVEELALFCDRVLVLAGGRIVGEQRAPHIEPAQLTQMSYESTRVVA